MCHFHVKSDVVPGYRWLSSGTSHSQGVRVDVIGVVMTSHAPWTQKLQLSSCGLLVTELSPIYLMFYSQENPAEEEATPFRIWFAV